MNPREPEPPQCENYGGGARCPRAATHVVRLQGDDGLYESELCGECFLGFRAEMIKQGMPPSNESAQHEGDGTE